jgi:3-hydroxyisobutyrate dehydrogenase
LTIFGARRGQAAGHPLFDALGQRTIWTGDEGSGTRLKLVANTWFAFAAEGVAASVALARGLGLETERVVVDALDGNPLVSPWQVAKLHRIAGGEFSAQFALSLALKDVRLAEEAADGRLGALACLADEWQQAVDQGLGHEDVTAVARTLEQEWTRP